MLFHRRFENFTGGHLKVWNYYQHVQAGPGCEARIYFSPETVWNETNPWIGERALALPEWKPEDADILFLGGHDWRALPSGPSCPVINLIQHVRHADPGDPLSGYLDKRAIRICVSEEVRDAIVATGRVNGPVFVIPNGIDTLALNAIAPTERPIDWLVCGMKDGQSGIARQLAARLRAAPEMGRAEAITRMLPRPEFLQKLAHARRAVLLPRETEGFYLPAIEAMALGTLVICPDCAGNRSFCQDGVTAIVPEGRGLEPLWRAVQRAAWLPPGAEAAMIGAARAEAARHDLARERAAFHELLARVPALW